MDYLDQFRSMVLMLFLLTPLDLLLEHYRVNLEMTGKVLATNGLAAARLILDKQLDDLFKPSSYTVNHSFDTVLPSFITMQHC